MLVHDRLLVHLDDGFRRWRVVAQGTVRSLRIVVFSPLFDNDLRFFQGIKYLPI